MINEQHYPEPTCGALIFNPSGQIFLMKSYKWRDQYVMPGGHIELGETIHNTLKREIKEETGLDIFDIQFLCLQEFIFDPVFWKKRHFIFLDFMCKTQSTDVQLDSEGQSYLWISPEKALQLPLEPYTRKAIDIYLSRQG